MKKVELLNLKGEKVKDINLNENVFGIEPNKNVLYDAIILARASLRQGTHSTKNRSETKRNWTCSSRFYQSCTMGRWRKIWNSSTKRLQQKTKS